ncbi:MAG: transcription elongation factor GreA [Chloroflexi bacterium]|nr:transcription elongation factor GreA [Chloroflexota bacterium]
MYDKPVFITREGRAKLEDELKFLREVRRPEVAERIKAAKEFSDTVDNAEFDEAKNEQAFVEGRILTLEKMIANAVIIENNHGHDIVRLGSRVIVSDPEGNKEEYTIVGTAEVRPSQGKISNESPVGRALLGRKIGDEVDVVAPAGLIRFSIVDID